MNVEKFYKIIDFILDDIKQYEIEQTFNSFVTALNQLVPATNNYNQPNMQQLQINYAKARDDFFANLETCQFNNMSFADKEVYNEIGSVSPLGIQLKELIEKTIEPNANLPAQMNQDVVPIQAAFNEYIKNLKDLTTSFKNLKIQKEPQLADDESEITILLPRTSINGEFKRFEMDIKVFRNLLDTVAEISGNKDGYRLEKISSSEFIITIVGICVVVERLAALINNLLDIFLKSLDIRTKLQEAKEQKAPKGVIDELKKWSDSVVDTGIKETVKITLKGTSITDKARINELTNSLTIYLKQILSRLDNGYQLTITMNKNLKPSDENDENTNENTQLQKDIKTLNANAEIIIEKIVSEGEILKLPILDFDDCLETKVEKTEPKKSKRKKQS